MSGSGERKEVRSIMAARKQSDRKHPGRSGLPAGAHGLLALVLLLIALPAGCSPPITESPRPRESFPARITPRDWKWVGAATVSGHTRTVRHVGYTRRDILDNRDGIIFVYDTERRRAGFFLPDGETNRYLQDTSTEMLGHFPPDESIRRILGVQGQIVRHDKVLP